MISETLNGRITVSVADNGEVFTKDSKGNVKSEGFIPVHRAQQMAVMQDDLLISRVLVREEFREALISAKTPADRRLSYFITVVALVLLTIVSVVTFDHTKSVVEEYSRPGFEICKTLNC